MVAGNKRPSNYRALILRAWREDGNDNQQETWRFRVRNLETGDQRGITSLSALLEHLQLEFFDSYDGHVAQDAREEPSNDEDNLAKSG